MATFVEYYVAPPTDPPHSVMWVAMPLEQWERSSSSLQPVGYDDDTYPSHSVARVHHKGRTILGTRKAGEPYCKIPAPGFRPPQLFDHFELLMAPKGTFKWLPICGTSGLPKLTHLVIGGTGIGGNPIFVCRLKSRSGRWSPATFSPGDTEARALFSDTSSPTFQILSR